MQPKATSGLDDYLTTAHGNVASVLERGGVWIRLLREIDTIFGIGGETLKPTPGTVVGGFVIGSHSGWLAATNLGLAMHLAESFQPLRACLESALYGYHVHLDHSAWDRWRGRPTVEQIEASGHDPVLMKKRKSIGREFSATAIAPSLPDGRLRARVLTLYDELIDHGAHFNFPVLKRAFRATGRGRDYYSAEVRILLGGEDEQVFGLQKLIDVGICALEVLDAGIGTEWDTKRIQSKLARVRASLARRHATRLSRRAG